MKTEPKKSKVVKPKKTDEEVVGRENELNEEEFGCCGGKCGCGRSE